MTQYIADLTSLPPHICLLILAAAVLGLFGGIALALLATLLSADQPRTHKKAHKSPRTQKLKSPKQHRKETERRATNRALMQVASTAITLPTRR